MPDSLARAIAFDAYVVAFRIPNLLRDLFAEGALSSAFVTVFTDYDQRLGPEKTWQLANNVIFCFTLLLSLLVMVGMWFSPDIVGVMAPDFGAVPGKLELTTLMTRIMFPFLILVSLAALAMGILNTKGKFFVPSLSSSFFNLGSVVAGVGLSLAAPGSGWRPSSAWPGAPWWVGFCNWRSSCRCCGGWGSGSGGSLISGNRDCCGSSS